jgi:molecular chaperone GrpE
MHTEDQTAAPSSEPSAAEQKVPTVEEQLALARTEVADMQDKLLRAYAEVENMRRRAERDVSDARAYGVTRFAADMLGISDNLARAIDAIPAEVKGKAEGALQGLIEGVEATARVLHQTFERHGIKALTADVGTKFDPHLHQAMFEVPTNDHPAGVIVQVLQAGFMLGDRVLRPAMVGVARPA